MCLILTLPLLRSRTRAYAVKRPVTAHAGYTGPRHRGDPACYKEELEVR
jgi:hypothetical protein